MAHQPQPLHLERLGVASLHDVSFTVEPGEITCLTGPSGCGKSRLLRAIADLEPHQGALRLGTTTADRLPAHTWRSRVMLVPAESQWWHRTVGEHLADPAEVDLTALGFGLEVLEWEVARLSSGEKQRLALLRALCRRPAALLLDEPTANLDPDTTGLVEHWLCGHIRERQLPTLWITHDLDQVARVGTHHLRFNGQLQLEAA